MPPKMDFHQSPYSHLSDLLRVSYYIHNWASCCSLLREKAHEGFLRQNITFWPYRLQWKFLKIHDIFVFTHFLHLTTSPHLLATSSLWTKWRIQEWMNPGCTDFHLPFEGTQGPPWPQWCLLQELWQEGPVRNWHSIHGSRALIAVDTTTLHRKNRKQIQEWQRHRGVD